ncbi:MAG TPA: ATP-binding protein, partial [Patescibacteria group bacterium]|nr:ATP-binding protein [Patescibacteria group bacterium]
KVRATEELLSRAVTLAQQVTSRTAIRDKLAAYDHGQVSLAAVADFSRDKLTDSLQLAPEIDGIVRLGAQGELVVAVGQPFPWEGALVPAPTVKQPLMSQPTMIDGVPHIVVAAPIIDNNGERLGTDLLLFDAQRLLGILHDPHQLGDTGDIAILSPGNPPRLLVPFRATTAMPASDRMAQIITRAAAVMDGSLVDADGDPILVGASIPGPGWVMLMRMDAHEANASVDHLILGVTLAAAALAAAGVLGLLTVLRPLTGGIIVQANDMRRQIVDLEQAKADLDRLRRRYELILDSAGEGIVGLDADGRISFINSKACGILSYSSEALLGRHFDALIDDSDKECTRSGESVSPLRQVYRDRIAVEVRDSVFSRQDGSTVQVEYQIAPIIEQGVVDGAVLMFRDVGLRRQYELILANQHRVLEQLVAERTQELRCEIDVHARTEGALRESQERLKGITDSLFEGVLVVDRTGVVVFANPSAKRLLGGNASRCDIEGSPLDNLFVLREEDRTIVFGDGPWQRVVTEGGMIRNEDGIFITASGTPLAVGYTCSPLGGIGQAAIISFREIEALKRAQREALQATRLASVGQLAAGIAHEINTPIQYVGDNLRFMRDSFSTLAEAITGLKALLDGGDRADEVAQLYGDKDIDYLLEEFPRATDQSRQGIEHVAHIVRSMKEFSHPGTADKVDTNLNRAIQNTLTVSRNVWKHVAIVVEDFDPALPSVPCHAAEINQVFLNLIVNAAHAVEASGKPLPGTITISTNHSDGYVEIRVSDTGTGIPDAIKDRIFDPFFTTKDVGQGTGQGLAICHDVVVTKHGGRIEVAGRSGEGAIFIVRLPTESDAATRADGENS